MTTDVFSRAILSGYDPRRLHTAKVAVVGLGALGQNVVQDLMLSGIGNILLVDFDDFEDHNATRSPFFPTGTEQSAYGRGKATIVAHRAAACATAPEVNVWYVDDLIQAAGDAAVRWADIVICAVDSVSARAWLSERCRVHGATMIEGGFAGPMLSLSSFAPGDNAPCYRCYNGSRISSGSCTQYAVAARAASIIPAIQTTAAVLGGLMAELAIQGLHGISEHSGRRLYGDIRKLTTDTAKLTLNPNCPGQHQILPTLGELAELPSNLDELVLAVYDTVGESWVMLSEPAIIAHTCTRCASMCRVQATESAWLRDPRCVTCGGEWQTADSTSPQAVSLLLADGSGAPEMRGILLPRIGLHPYGAVTVQKADGEMGTLTFPGDPCNSWARALPE